MEKWKKWWKKITFGAYTRRLHRQDRNNELAKAQSFSYFISSVDHPFVSSAVEVSLSIKGVETTNRGDLPLRISNWLMRSIINEFYLVVHLFARTQEVETNGKMSYPWHVSWGRQIHILEHDEVNIFWHGKSTFFSCLFFNGSTDFSASSSF